MHCKMKRPVIYLYKMIFSTEVVMKYIICSIFGDVNVICGEDTLFRIKSTVEKLITEHGVGVFLFSGRSEFEMLCLKAVRLLKAEYPDIRLLYVRDEYKYANDEDREFVAKHFDDSFSPFDSKGRKTMRYTIDSSELCVFYFDKASKEKSGAKTAYRYAKRRKKDIVNLLL